MSERQELAEAVSKQMATISIERNTAVKSIVVRFCANAFIKNRQNRKLRMWFCVFTHPRPPAARGGLLGQRPGAIDPFPPLTTGSLLASE